MIISSRLLGKGEKGEKSKMQSGNFRGWGYEQRWARNLNSWRRVGIRKSHNFRRNKDNRTTRVFNGKYYVKSLVNGTIVERWPIIASLKCEA